MSDEKLFHYLASRIQTRETSIHTIAIITSSASLLLFVLYFSGDFSSTIQDEVTIRLLGILRLWQVIHLLYKNKIQVQEG